MRKNYSLSSQEINDKFYSYYRDLIYLTGFENADTGETYSGVYDTIEVQGNLHLEDTKIGIPHIGNNADNIGSNIAQTSEEMLTLLEIRYKLDRYLERYEQ